MHRLCDLVEEVLANNLDMSSRPRGIGSRLADTSGAPATVENHSESVRSTIASETKQLPGPPGNPVPQHNFRSAFEEDLDASKVYKRALYNRSQLSLISYAARSTSSSLLSGLSFGDVSIIAVFALPLYSSDITNHQHYTFGDVSEQPLNLVTGEPGESQKKSAFHSWKQSSPGLANFRLPGSRASSIQPEPDKRIFGVPLEESSVYARNTISILAENGESFIRYIPIIVAKCGMYLKEKGVN